MVDPRMTNPSEESHREVGCSIWYADTKEAGFDFKHTVKPVSCVLFFAWVPRKLSPNSKVQEFLTCISAY